MSTARDRETAPEPHAAEDGPILPRSQPKPAAAQTTVPKTALISTRPPPGQPHPTRVDGGYHDPRDAAPEAGSGLPPKACEAANAPQCPSGDSNRPANPSARKVQPMPASGSTPGAPKTAPGSPPAPRRQFDVLEHSDPCAPALTTTAGEFSTRRPRVQNQAMDIPKPLTGRKRAAYDSAAVRAMRRVRQQSWKRPRISVPRWRRLCNRIDRRSGPSEPINP